MLSEDQVASTGWAILGAVFTMMLGWLIRLERRSSQVMTRAEHEAICEKKQVRIEEKLEAITDTLNEQNEKAQMYRENMATTLGHINEKLAVMRVQVNVNGKSE